MVFDLVERRNDVLLTMPKLDIAQWSPKGHEIAFTGYPAFTDHHNLYVYNLTDKKLSLLIDATVEPSVWSFAWGPTGKSIVYQDSDNDVRIIDLDKKTREKLDKGWSPTWSPNGRFIAYGEEDEPYRKWFVVHNLQTHYVLYDLRTHKKESILVGKVATGSLVWSPDSRYLVQTRVGQDLLDYVFALMMGETRFGDLYVVDLQTKAEVRVYSGNSVYPTDWGKTSVLK
jgi:Tol biopolymer transport system component